MKLLYKITNRSLIILMIINFCICISQAGEISKPNFDLGDACILLYNIDTNTIVYKQNEHVKVEPASLVKTMTAIIDIENIKDIDNTFVTAKGYIFDELYGKNCSVAGIVRGEILTVRQLLQCMLIQSAAEASMMLADAVCPDDIPQFVDMMNEKAKKLGAKNTLFANTYGNHEDTKYYSYDKRIKHEPGQYTTAYDMFLITKYAMSLPHYMDIVSSVCQTISATNKRDSFEVYTTIDPMKKSSNYYYPPIKGIKTGTENFRAYVSSAKKDGLSYICCVLGAPYSDDKGRPIRGNKAFEYTIKLYEWAFNNFKIKTISQVDVPITEVKLKYVFNKDHLKLTTGKNIMTLVPNKTNLDDIKKFYYIPKEVCAPIKKGDLIGTVKFTLDGKIISEENVVSAETVSKNWFLYALDLIKKTFSFIVFKILVGAIIIFILIVIISRRFNKKRRRYKK